MTKLQQQYDQALQRTPKITHQENYSVTPIEIEVVFHAPLAYRGLRLLAQADDVFRKILQVRHVALAPDAETQKALHTAGRIVRGCFDTVKPYQNTGVTIEDLKQRNEKALNAERTLGSIPEEVLSGKRKPSQFIGSSLSTKRNRFA